MQRRRRTFWIGVLPAILFIGLVAWALNTPNRGLPVSQQLPDGTVETIRKVSYGKVLKYPVGNFWHRIAVQLLPVSITEKLGFHIDVFTNATATTFIVVENIRTNGSLSAGPGMPWVFGDAISVQDDAGNSFSLSSYTGRSISSNDVMEVFAVPLVSHLATNLNLQLTRNSWTQLSNYAASFVVRNPAPRRKPRWKPAAFPMTNQSDDLTVVFSRMPPDTNHVQILERGVPSTNWSLAGYTVEDEEGNVSGADVHFSPREPRKFRFELLRLFPTGPSDILTFHDIVPARSNGVFSPIQSNFQSHVIQITHFTGGSLIYTVNPGPTDRKTSLAIAYNERNANGSGRTTTYLGTESPAGASIGFGPPIPDSVKTADIIFTFTPFTDRFVEFIVLPEPMATDPPVKR